MAFARWPGCRRLLILVGVMVAVLSAHAQDIVVGQIGPFTVLPAPDAHEINKGAKA